MKYCGYCGRPVEDGQRYCANCGKFVGGAQSTSQPPHAQQQAQYLCPSSTGRPQ